MSLRDDLIPMVEEVRGIPADMGVHIASVYVRTETYAAAISDGSTPSSTSDVQILPIPHVEQLSVEDAIMYGGGVVTDSTGRVQSSVYSVGPITPLALGRGYAISDLMPTTSTPSKRVSLVLSGDGFQSGGEPMQIVRCETRAFRIMLTVRRMPKVPNT